MLLNIPNILSPEETGAILKTLTDIGSSVWQDGASSAYGAAEKVKKNRQCDPNHPVVGEILEKARLALLKDGAFAAATQPEKFSRLMINSYEPGMSYGNHLDAPYIKDIRTDVSITLFLTPPNSYEGGELVLMTPFGEMAVRGEQGSVFLYPSTYLHRVDQVTSGHRIAIVGWLKSRFNLPHHREILFDLERSISDVRDNGGNRETHMRLLSVKNRLLREWGQ